jgi:hypothetical protein
MMADKRRQVEPDSQGPPARFDFINRLPEKMLASECWQVYTTFTQGSYGCDYSFSREVSDCQGFSTLLHIDRGALYRACSAIVPMQDNKAAATISSVQKADVVMDVVGKDVVEEDEPLNGLNVQLTRVYGDACMLVERGQR